MVSRFHGKKTVLNHGNDAARLRRQRTPIQSVSSPTSLRRWTAGYPGKSAILTRPEAIRAMMDTVLHILPGEKLGKKAKAKKTALIFNASKSAARCCAGQNVPSGKFA